MSGPGKPINSACAYAYVLCACVCCALMGCIRMCVCLSARACICMCVCRVSCYWICMVCFSTWCHPYTCSERILASPSASTLTPTLASLVRGDLSESLEVVSPLLSLASGIQSCQMYFWSLFFTWSPLFSLGSPSDFACLTCFAPRVRVKMLTLLREQAGGSFQIHCTC